MKAFIFIVVTILISSLSFAGSGHDHGHGHSHSHYPAIKKEKVILIGRAHINRLVKAKKINESWIKSTLDKTELKKKEWLVTFNNDKGVKGKRKLYIFLKKSGEFVAANFSGK